MNSLFDEPSGTSRATAEFEATLRKFAARTASEMRTIDQEHGADAAARHGQLVLAQWLVALLDTGELDRADVEKTTRHVMDLIAENLAGSRTTVH